MSNFEELKVGLKDQWLDYYESNREWINKVVPRYNTGPINLDILAYIILGVVTTIEPRLKAYLEPFSQLNKEPRSLIHILGLGGNPDSELEDRRQKRERDRESMIDPDTEYLNQIREQARQKDL